MIKVMQVRSHIRRPGIQRLHLAGLGLGRIGRVRVLHNTPTIRGMIAKVKHLVRVLYESRQLSRLRFNALAGYTRMPDIVVLFEEIEWHGTADERVIGTLVRDRVDNDFGWVILARDERLRFRGIAVNASLPTLEAAKQDLFANMEAHWNEPDEEFYQGDAPGPPTDFFTPIAPEERLNQNFRILTREERFSPARELMKAMMRFYEDVDGNFVEQFQTAAFDARLWEIYQFATFAELGYAPTPEVAIPDFIFDGPLGQIGIEATSVSPEGGDARPPQDQAKLQEYIENYIPIKLGRALRRKLEMKNPYWEKPEMEGVPFVLSIQDFHVPHAMIMIMSPMVEYVFGVRHTVERGQIRVEWIDEHVWEGLREKSGFFGLPNAENISAVIFNPQGTLPKFNRMGYLAGFGNPRVRMVRHGMARSFGYPLLKSFVQEVHKAGYAEGWVEGMVVIHNPRARIKLPPEMISGACHEFLQPDGRIMSLVPEFHPIYSLTHITIAGKKGK